MRYVRAMLTTLIVLTCIEAVAAAQDDGYQESDVNDPGVVSAARFAVRAANRRERVPVTFVSLERAETQAVAAGSNYRLRLSVRRRGEILDARAEVYRHPRRGYSLTRWEMDGRSSSSSVSGGTTTASRAVKVYLVAVNDQGRAGRKIGCDDSLVPVTRTIKATGAPLKAALVELLSLPREYEGGLSNFWRGRNLRLTTVSLRAGVATIRIAGELFVAGVCDAPRIEAQIEETARQFPNVRNVRVFIGRRTLAQAVR
ncbi:MAG TPA: hypothetical protein VF703_01940 [Pyrinomonadaceae bacterium]|jgi:hypothetical protein